MPGHAPNMLEELRPTPATRPDLATSAMGRTRPGCSRCGLEPPRPEALDSNWVVAMQTSAVLCPTCHEQTTRGLPDEFGWTWRRIVGLTDDDLDALVAENAERAAQMHAWATWFDGRGRAQRGGVAD